jgi:hypothetical protein
MSMRHKKRMRLLGTAVAAVALLGVGHGLKADVFLRGPGLPDAWARAGLSQIHKASMEVNGESMTLEVFAANGDLGRVAAVFADAVKEKNPRAWFCLRPTTAFGFSQQDNRLTHYLFVQIERGQTLLYTLHQAYPPKQSPAAAGVLPPDFPVYPGAQPTMAISHQETHTRFASYAAGATTAVVQSYYQQALTERGWKEMAMATVVEHSPQGVSQQMYRKGNSVCVIGCECVPMSGEVTITVLMKDSTL